MLLAALTAVSISLVVLALAHLGADTPDPLDPPVPLPAADEPFEPSPTVPPSKPADGGALEEPSGPTLYGRLAPVALLVLGLLAPGVAHADGLGSIIIGSSGGVVGIGLSVILGLAGALHLWDKAASFFQKVTAPPVVIPGSPKLSAGLQALESATLDVIHDLAAAVPGFVAAVEAQLKTKSLADVGAWIVANYEPTVLTQAQSRATTLAGQEIAVFFSSATDLNEAAALKLGAASQKAVATAKLVKALPSGSGVVVAPAAN